MGNHPDTLKNRGPQGLIIELWQALRYARLHSKQQLVKAHKGKLNKFLAKTWLRTRIGLFIYRFRQQLAFQKIRRMMWKWNDLVPGNHVKTLYGQRLIKDIYFSMRKNRIEQDRIVQKQGNKPIHINDRG